MRKPKTTETWSFDLDQIVNGRNKTVARGLDTNVVLFELCDWRSCSTTVLEGGDSCKKLDEHIPAMLDLQKGSSKEAGC